MQKTTTNFKTMLLAAIVLVMIQACVPNSPINGNPTPSLTGKIKSVSYTIPNSNNAKIITLFDYNSSATLTDLRTVTLTDSTIYKYDIIYQTNKLIVNDSATNLPIAIYYLHQNTNLIDSVDGSNTTRKIIERDDSNNLVSIASSSSLNKIVVTDFLYENGNLKSYNIKTSFGGFPASDIIYTCNYDLTKTHKAGINPFGLTSGINSLYGGMDPDFFGLSIGNTNTNAMSSFSWEEHWLPGGSGILNYNYTSYSNTNASLDFSGTTTNIFLQWQSINIIYY